MAIALSRIASPTLLLYAFVVTTQVGFGIYYERQIEPPPAFTLIYAMALLWIVGWWWRTDSRKRGIPWVYDMGFFLNIAWPFVMPYYLLKSRGAKGLLVILGFASVYVGAVIVGIIIAVFAEPGG